MPVPSRRKVIDPPDLKPSEPMPHAGLWLDRMLPTQVESDDKITGEHPYTTLIHQACGIPEPHAYERYYERWRTAVKQLPQYAYCQLRESRVRGRMVVGLGNESVLETAVMLHRTYGVPYIPGSALKGVAATYAHRFLADASWHKPQFDAQGNPVPEIGAAHRIMFGDTSCAGYVTFFDALYIPGSGHSDAQGRARGLWPDVLTVHHRDYYGETKDNVGNIPPPTDWDSPTPVSFVSATGTYCVVLAGPEAWVETAFDILALALDELGVGGKTASGYGRLTLACLERARKRLERKQREPSGASSAPPPADPDQQATEALIARIQSLPNPRVANDIHQYFQRWQQLPVRADLKHQVARALLAKIDEAGRTKASQDKPWYQELLASLAASTKE